MLNEVKLLCKNDFSGIVKQYEVFQIDYAGGETKLGVFDTEIEAKKYVIKYFSGCSDIYTAYEIRKVKYVKR